MPVLGRRGCNMNGEVLSSKFKGGDLVRRRGDEAVGKVMAVTLSRPTELDNQGNRYFKYLVRYERLNQTRRYTEMALLPAYAPTRFGGSGKVE